MIVPIQQLKIEVLLLKDRFFCEVLELSQICINALLHEDHIGMDFGGVLCDLREAADSHLDAPTPEGALDEPNRSHCHRVMAINSVLQ